MSFRDRVCLSLFFAAILLGLSTCTVAPVTVPAPLAELPSFLTFPEDLEINLDKISSSEAASNIRLQTGVGADFTFFIQEGPDRVDESNQQLNNILAILQDLAIPLSPTILQVTEPDSDSSRVLKIDFSDFDYDGNGSNEGCSGCTCPAGCNIESCPGEAPLDDIQPVCFRIWVDNFGTGEFIRLMAGFFDQLPVRDDPSTGQIETNSGSGQFRAQFIDASTEGVTTIAIGAIYDHREPVDPFGKFTALTLIEKLVSTPDKKLIFEVKNRSLIDQGSLAGTTDDDEVLVNVKTDFRSESFDPSSFVPTIVSRYIGEFRRDANFWMGTVLFESPTVNKSFNNQCAQISSGNGVLQGACLDLGIDVTGESFIAPAEISEVSLPADFPDSPPF